MQTIIVQMSDRQWTMQALHLACALARNNHAQVILLRLIAVNYPGYLGTPFGNGSLTRSEYADIKEFVATAEDYGIELSLSQMQCVSSPGALADAANELKADVVFAHVPESRIPYWRRLQVWNLERRLSHCQLFTLDKSGRSPDEALSITLEPLNVSKHPAVTRQS